MPLVQLNNASFGYRRRSVIAGVSCVVEAGRCLGIYGPNGVGKSTLLRGMTGLLAPLTGTVDVAPGMRFGYLPQQRAGESHWPMTSLDAASMAISAQARFGFLRGRQERVLSRMDELGVVELAGRPFFQLSGGQQQRVLLAGAFAADPSVLVLDEPMSGVDAGARELLIEHLQRAKANGLAILIVSHDVADLLALADTALLLEPAADAGKPSRGVSIAADDIVSRLTAGRSGFNRQPAWQGAAS
ncbi:metal ABC transporter ATP-binding protein [Humisphaera borealis]|uniref:ATP-binding cassette domain-containing protein n=1 Tax=Humisphaera borealis TaxID=2807512 RepID=A0A7M2WUB6_9BACT|nr:ATP-binding cassette domain-containing protein [Humisphaera borealis]QOV88391.1 ATP-binding cassette domain-containing protein [Humisphaera borealis]